MQIELFEVETEKKESIPNLRMRDFLRSEVLTHTHTHTHTQGLHCKFRQYLFSLALHALLTS